MSIDFKYLSKLKDALPYAMQNQNMSVVIETMKYDCEKNKGVCMFKVVGIVKLAIAAFGTFALLQRWVLIRYCQACQIIKNSGDSYYK